MGRFRVAYLKGKRYMWNPHSKHLSPVALDYYIQRLRFLRE